MLLAKPLNIKRTIIVTMMRLGVTNTTNITTLPLQCSSTKPNAHHVPGLLALSELFVLVITLSLVLRKFSGRASFFLPRKNPLFIPVIPVL